MCHLNTVCNKKWSSSYSYQLSEGLLVKVSLSFLTVVDNKVINLRYFPVFHFLIELLIWSAYFQFAEHCAVSGLFLLAFPT